MGRCSDGQIADVADLRPIAGAFAQRKSHKIWSATKSPSRLSRSRARRLREAARLVSRRWPDRRDASRSKPVRRSKSLRSMPVMRSAQHQDRGLSRPVFCAIALRWARWPASPDSIRRRYAFMSRVLTERTPAKVTRGPDSEAEIRVVGPVDQVVSRLVAWSGEVGDLVHLEPGRGQPLDRRTRTSSARFPRRPARPVRSAADSKGRSPSRIPARNTRDVRVRARARSRGPARQSSMVEPGTPKIRSSDQRGKRGRTISTACSTSASTVMALQNPQQIGLERLGAQTDAVHAGVGQDVGLVGIERARIGLDGPLATRARGSASADHRGQAVPAERASSRVGVPPPTKIVSTSWGSSRTVAISRSSAAQVAVGQMIDARQRSEVAVAALVGAERDMNVGRARPKPPRLAGIGRAARDHGTASTKRISGTAALRVDSTRMLRVTTDEEQPWQAPVSRT